MCRVSVGGETVGIREEEGHGALGLRNFAVPSIAFVVRVRCAWALRTELCTVRMVNCALVFESEIVAECTAACRNTCLSVGSRTTVLRWDCGGVSTWGELRHRTCVGVHTRATMDIQVAVRGRVLGCTITCYEMRDRRGEDDGRVYDFVKPTTSREVRQYEVDADGQTVLYASLCLGFEDDVLCEAVGHVAKVGRAIPNRWDGGVDVLADIVDLLICNIADEFEDRKTDDADFRVQPDPPLHDRPGLGGDIRKMDD
ncbi:hypothetical protein CBR_g19887 [Chara braunii]|uniref:Uncharacterized protein n=1 Tax=Chara braunii TaxID=69332 RepID=A0A388KZ69_CHABU|nr:hypothetical protein CBR_g19887 [Chara braunii]|eukprot:GBG75253.1 hypothetical protein CBR_g19887 [Chara braunii]